MTRTRLFWMCLLILGAGRCGSIGPVLFAADPANDAPGTGRLTGTMLYDGEIPAAKPLVAAGAAPVCGMNPILSDRLLIDPKSRGVRNVFVYMLKKPAGYQLPVPAEKERDVFLDQINCRFVPHAAIVRTNQTLKVVSADNGVHNVRTSPLTQASANLIVQGGDRWGVTLPFTRSEPIPVKVDCDIHSWMTAYVLVADHPFAALTDEQGKFQIANVPAGTHNFRIWHEQSGYLEKSITVKITAGEATDLDAMRIPAARFEGKP